MEKIREGYTPEGTCAKNFVIDMHKDDNGELIFDELRMFGGKCAGNSQVLNRLASGKKVKDLIPQIKDIVCSNYRSCFGELAKALESYLDKQNGVTPLVVSHKRKPPLTMDKDL